MSAPSSLYDASFNEIVTNHCQLQNICGVAGAAKQQNAVRHMLRFADSSGGGRRWPSWIALKIQVLLTLVLVGHLLSVGQGATSPLTMTWTPNKITLFRVFLGFLAVVLFGKNPWLNLLGVALTVSAIALDALDGHVARTKKMATPEGAQIDILGDRMIENMYFTYFAVVGMVSLWLPMLFFARGAATDFLRGLAMKAGHSGWGANALLQNKWAQVVVASPWSRGAYASLKCLCFCYLGLELALMHGPVALLGPVTTDLQATIRTGAHLLAWTAAAFCVVRGLPVLLGGWRYFAEKLPAQATKQHTEKHTA